MTLIHKKENRFVWAVFWISVIIRTVLGCYYPRTVNCYPDEALYLSAAASLWNQHKVLAFNLPTDFGKIGYSLLIAPAFAFSNLRVRTMAIGFISALVMSLGLFPVNALAKKLLKEERFRRWSLLFYALSATMTYSMTYASEVLFIPVMVLLIYLIYQLLTDAWHGKKKILMLVVTVLVWLLAYLVKELVLVIPVALVLYFVTDRLLGWRQRKGMEKDDVAPGKKQTWKFLLALLLMAVACIGIYLFSNAGTQYYQLGFDLTLLQERFWYLLYGTLFFIVSTLIAFLFLPVLYPVIFGRTMEKNARKLCLFLVYVIVVTAAVVSYTIYIYEDYPSLTPRAHIRYVEYLFVPFLILLFHLLEQKRPVFAFRHVLALAAALGLCLVSFVGFNGQTIDHTMLFFVQVFSQDGHTFLPYKARLCVLLLIVIVAIFTYLFYNKSKFFITLLLSGILIVSLGNNILSTYVQYKTHTHTQAETTEAEQVCDFVREHADVGIGVIEPVTHEELLDTFLIDCDNVRNIGIAGGWYFALTQGNIKKYGLWSEGEVAKYAGYGAPQTLDYILVSNDAYTIEETDAMTQVAEYPNLGYTLYKLKDPTHLPVMYGGTVE